MSTTDIDRVGEWEDANEQRRIDKATHETYGALRANIHIAGYTLERAFADLKYLLVENRWREVGPGFDHINEFIGGIRLDNFRMIAEHRKDIAQQIKRLQPDASNRKIANMLGVGRRTIDRDVGPNGPPNDENPNNFNGGNSDAGPNGPPLSLDGAEDARLGYNRAARKERDRIAGEKQVEEARAAAKLVEVKIEIREGRFQAVLADLRDVDAIITDPPYERDALMELYDLARWADKVLRPEGIMAVLYGQTYLPEALEQLNCGRPYRWTACYLTGGAGYVSHARKAQANWKPLLIYGGCEPRFSDLFCSAGDDQAAKERHRWGQNFEAFKDIIERLTKPGQLIADPFMGGGTTLLAAKTLGRHAVGCDVDSDSVNAARKLLYSESVS